MMPVIMITATVTEPGPDGAVCRLRLGGRFRAVAALRPGLSGNFRESPPAPPGPGAGGGRLTWSLLGYYEM
jgi:hypothetical protein